MRTERRAMLTSNLVDNSESRKRGLRAIGFCSRCEECTPCDAEGYKQFEHATYPYYTTCECGGRIRWYDRAITCERCDYKWLPNVKEPKACPRCQFRRDKPKQEWSRNESYILSSVYPTECFV